MFFCGAIYISLNILQDLTWLSQLKSVISPLYLLFRDQFRAIIETALWRISGWVCSESDFHLCLRAVCKWKTLIAVMFDFEKKSLAVFFVYS